MYNHTTFEYGQVIDRDWFSSEEWSTTQPMKISNNFVYEEIREQCLQVVADEKECVESEFEDTTAIDPPTKQIDLQFDVVQSVEEEPSWYKLALDIASIECTLFGLTALSILQVIASFVQVTLRESKLILFLLYLLCSVGAIWHSYHILHLVVSGDLVATRYYELAKHVQMPAMAFCLRIDQKLVDSNHQLTGNYLEELTRQMNVESTFTNVTYLDESNEWVLFELSRVEWFFLLDMKCFTIDIDQEYDRDQFHFSTDSQVLRVNFINTLDEENCPFYD